jgi:predicted nucleic acid-binding protein
MRTSLDTNILSPLWSGEPSAVGIPAQLETIRSEGALVVCGPVFVELAAHPFVDVHVVGKLLREMNISVDFDLGEDIWRLAASAFAAYAVRRRRSGGGSPKRLLVDFIVASYAVLKADRLMTRDANRYRHDFPNLRLI